MGGIVLCRVFGRVLESVFLKVSSTDHYFGDLQGEKAINCERPETRRFVPDISIDVGVVKLFLSILLWSGTSFGSKTDW